MTTDPHTNDDTRRPAIRAEDASKYAAALLKSRFEWTGDAIGGAMCDGDHELELDALDDTVAEILALAALFGSRRRYSDGRAVESSVEIEQGLVTSHIWYPVPGEEAPASHRGHLLSGDPDVPSPGIYEVTTDPVTQDIHVRVVRLT
jgi:hypothetical protein